MNERNPGSSYCDWAFCLSCIACLTAVFRLFGGADGEALMVPCFLPWAAGMTLTGWILRRFLRSDRSYAAAAGVAAACWGVQSAVCLIFFAQYHGLFACFTALSLWAAIAGLCMRTAIRHISPESFNRVLEAAVLCLALALLSRQSTGSAGYTEFPLAVAVGADLLGLTLLRTGGSGVETLSRPRGILVLLVVLGAFFSLTLLAVWGGAAPLGSAVRKTGTLLGKILSAAGGLIQSFFLWMGRLFPSNEEGTLPPVGSAAPTGTPQGAEISNPHFLPALFGVAAVLAAVTIVLLLHRFGRRKIHGTGRKLTVSRHRNHTALRALLRQAEALWGSAVFCVQEFCFRSTAPGVLLYLERWAALHRAARKPGETHRAFLRRIATPQSEGQLKKLADALDLRYYGETPGEYFPADARAVRKLYRKGTVRRAGEKQQ